MFTIHNKGLREIHFDGGILKPNSYLKINQVEADKLFNLFPNEITIIERIAEIAQASVPDKVEVVQSENSAEIDDLNKSQLLDIAKQMGLEVSDKATKKDLVSIISEAKAGDAE